MNKMILARFERSEKNNKLLLERVERLERIIVDLAGDALKDSTTGGTRSMYSTLTEYDGEELRRDVKYRDTEEVRRYKSWGEFN